MPAAASVRNWPEPWPELVAKAKSVAGLAAMLGVSESTLWRWAFARAEPGLARKRWLNQWATRHKVTPPYPELLAPKKVTAT